MGGKYGSFVHADRGVSIQQPLADGDAGGNPPHRPPDPHLAEIPVPIGKVVKGQRVGQRHRRGIQQGVGQGKSHESRVAVDARQLPDQDSSGEVGEGQELLGGEPAVGDLAGDEGGDDCSDRSEREDVANLGWFHLPVVPEKLQKDGKPGPPDCVLKEHHPRKPGPKAGSELRGEGLQDRWAGQPISRARMFR